jgi:hypothetical protein
LNVPFLALSRESERAREEFEGAFRRVTERGHYVLGPELEAFEAEFAAWLGVRHAVGVGSGTDAIALALEASGAVTPRADWEVLTPALSAAFTALAIHRAGAVPRFVDVDPATLQIDPGRLERAISPRARAIVPVHLYGNACDIAAVCEAARARGLAVIEDACQAHGSRLAGRALGAFGAAGCFSFYPTKNMTTGEGGMVTTADPAVADRARLLREHGMRVRYQHETIGYNFRMTDIHASIGLGQLPKLPAYNARRRAIAARYDRELQGVITPHIQPGVTHVYHQYTLRVNRRDEFVEQLKERGVGTGVYYPIPVHRQKPFLALGYGDQRFPVSERLANEVLSIPVHPSLTDEEVEAVIAAVNGVAVELGPIPAAAHA